MYLSIKNLTLIINKNNVSFRELLKSINIPLKDFYTIAEVNLIIDFLKKSEKSFIDIKKHSGLFIQNCINNEKELTLEEKIRSKNGKI